MLNRREIHVILENIRILKFQKKPISLLKINAPKQAVYGREQKLSK